MSKASYDAIVLGTGGVGSAALWELARRGLRVLGIDRFAPPHDHGSSHGQTRIIRQAYFEHADYVPLLLESYRLWRELERRAGRELLRECGLLEVGPADGIVVPGVLTAARRHGLDVEQLSASQIAARWPAFRVPDELVGVYEPRAGYLHVEECVRAHLVAAQEAGAELRVGVEVLDWSADGEGVVVNTTTGKFSAGRLVVTAGAWAGQLLKSLGLNLRVRRQVVMWHATDDARAHVDAGFPCYLFELPEPCHVEGRRDVRATSEPRPDPSADLGVTSRVFYGFPAIDDRGLKAAEHSSGRPIADPSLVDRGLHDADRAPVEAFLRSHLPAVKTPCREHSTCLYTISPDEHFLVDRHPEHGQVVFAAGLSGHGFKFAPVLGVALADLALNGSTRLPIEFLARKRLEPS